MTIYAKNVNLNRLTSFKLNGNIQSLITIESSEDLINLPDRYRVLGGGSNVIINPGIDYPLVRVSPKFCSISMDGEYIICSAGVGIAQLLKWMTLNERSGLEFSAGVPATLGGMVVMNFECWGDEISSMVNSVLVFSKDKGLSWVNRNQYQVGYRWTSFHESNEIVLAVKLKTTYASKETIQSLILENIQQRKEKQPLLKSTFGSVFKNPLPKKAGKLIDEIGLKGAAEGDVMVSSHHANFFENMSKGTYDDTIKLIRKIQKKVLNHYNIKLECEVKIIQ